MFDEIVRFRIAEIREGIQTSNELLGPDDPRYREGDDLLALEDAAVEAQLLRVDDLTLSNLEGIAPAITEWAEAEGLLRLDGWNLQNASQSGEAAATVDAFLREDTFPDGDFLLLDAYQQGGKPLRVNDDIFSRIGHKITSTLRITHPTNYTVISAQRTIDKPVDPSQPPPVDEVQAGEPTFSVVLIRDLGNLRVIPALLTFASFVFFAATCLVLHWRDLNMREKGLDV